MSTELLQIQDQFVKSIVAGLWSFIKIIWPTWGPYIITAIILIIASMIWQIILFRGGSDKKLSAGFNRLVGSIFYWVFFYLISLVFYFILGPRIIDGIWFAIFVYPAYRLNKLFLKWIGFWYY